MRDPAVRAPKRLVSATLPYVAQAPLRQTPAMELASQRLTERGLPLLPQITLYSLRRTYVAIMLHATEYDIAYVQSQVGHAHARMTLEVQLLDRRKREHGAAFDKLLTDARDTLYSPHTEAPKAVSGHRSGHQAKPAPKRRSPRKRRNSALAGTS